MKERSPITTHVLDVHRGRPAAGVAVTLERETGPQQWKRVAAGTTDGDGRIEDLLPRGSAAPAGLYRLTFDTAPYFEGQGTESLYPSVTIAFRVTQGHYHIPLLLNANGYTTYRGS